MNPSDPTTPKEIITASGAIAVLLGKMPNGHLVGYVKECCMPTGWTEGGKELSGRNSYDIAEPSAPAEPTHIHSAIFDHGKPVPRDPKCFGCIAITERVVTQQAKAPGAPASTVCECEHPYYGCQVAGTLAKCERCGKLVAPGAPADPVESLVESAKRLARATDHLLADTRSSPSRTATVRDLVKITKRNFETALAAYEGRRQ